MAHKAPAEEQLIEQVRRRMESAQTGPLRLGIGDDAAILRPTAGREWVLTCDQFLEGVHFIARVHSADVVGYKALARATSDVAAMGARPRIFLLSMALPDARTGKWLEQMTAGMARAAHRFGLTLAGGDTARSPNGVALSITVLGDIPTGYAVRRSGARPGDAIFVTGHLGEAQAGLELTLRGLARQTDQRAEWRCLVAAHNYPEPCIALGQWLAQGRLVSAMMDLSDGLSVDLLRLCKSSGVGARINEADLPAVVLPSSFAGAALPGAALPEASARGAGVGAFSRDARELALHGGEDYGLLFTARPKLLSKIPAAFGRTRITRIGEIVRGRSRLTLVSPQGDLSPLPPLGWDHFRTAKNPKRKAPR